MQKKTLLKTFLKFVLKIQKNVLKNTNKLFILTDMKLVV